jgi:hypothetical protein
MIDEFQTSGTSPTLFEDLFEFWIDAVTTRLPIRS